MSDLKTQLLYYLKKYHQGRKNTITVQTLANEFKELKVSEYQIRLALRELNLEKKPIVTFTDPPAGVCYATDQEEIDRYRSSLVSRLASLKKRIEALDGIRLEPEQMVMWK